MKTNRFIAAALIFTILAVIFFGFFSLRLSASPKTEAIAKETHYKSIIIEENDSLWSIAERFAPTLGISTKEYIKRLKEINNLTSSLIIAGTNIIVLYGL